MVLVFSFSVQQAERNLLLPLIIGGQARIPRLVSLIAFLVGALIAIPLIGTRHVVVVRVLVPAGRDLIGVDSAEAAALHREEIERDVVENEEGN